MPKFYFTYGTDKRYPFQGGWTEVEAGDANEACRIFRSFHPDRTKGIVNCASIYSEEQFQQTEMYRSGNFDRYCHEVLKKRKRRRLCGAETTANEKPFTNIISRGI